MGRLRSLNCVAAGMAGSFISRNNELGGYWAMGKLKSMAAGRGETMLTIALRPSGRVVGDRQVEILAQRYRVELDRLVASKGLRNEVVSTARVEVRFAADQTPPPGSAARIRGAPCSVRVVLEDDRGRTYARSRDAICDRHKWWRELKGGRWAKD